VGEAGKPSAGARSAASRLVNHAWESINVTISKMDLRPFE
jgi:hypothetical protein